MLQFEDWGEIEYSRATQQQLELVQQLAASENERVVFCTHPPVVTVGRGTRDGDVFSWSGPVLETSRGGRATYHGPNQLVIYPILNLNADRQSFARRDIHAYLRALEQSLVAALRRLDIRAEARTTQLTDDNGGKLSLTGVWVGERKLASIGVAVKKWISYHGAAVNVDRDDDAFQGIHPCGFSSQIMTSVEELLGRRIPRAEIKSLFREQLTQHLS